MHTRTRPHSSGPLSRAISDAHSVLHGRIFGKMCAKLGYANTHSSKSKQANLGLFLCCLSIDGPISGPPSCTQNAGAEKRCCIKISRGPVWLDSAVQLDTSVRLGVAISWEMKVVSIRCIAAFDSVSGFFCHQRSTDTANDF